MELNELYLLAEEEGIAVDAYDFCEHRCISVTLDGRCYIGINPFALLSAADEKCKLAHEIGHCETGTFYQRSTNDILRRRCETKADRWAIKKLIPKNELIKALKLGTTDNLELAEHFGVTEDFLEKAIKFYCEGELS